MAAPVRQKSEISPAIDDESATDHIEHLQSGKFYLFFLICEITNSNFIIKQIKEGASSTSSGDRFRDVRPPKWVNPCGGILDDTAVDPDAPPLEDSEIAANAILDVEIALNQIELFKNNFVSFFSTFDYLRLAADIPDVINIPSSQASGAPQETFLLKVVYGPVFTRGLIFAASKGLYVECLAGKIPVSRGSFGKKKKGFLQR